MQNKLTQAGLWRQDITGLRALAVLPVLVFHGFPGLLPGGFFGVDVFFVISGYLISGIIFRGLKDDSFSFSSFYAKRVKRIAPNLLIVLFVVVVLSWLTMTPREAGEIGKYVFTAALFVLNFRLIGQAENYFAIESEYQPLLHIWSLSIEEQFYLFFPLLCFLIWSLSGNKVKKLGVFVGVVVVGSLLACLATKDDVYRFYFPISRFWELGFGILLSYYEIFFNPHGLVQEKWVRNGLSIMGLSLILISMIKYSSSFTTPGWISLIPVLGATMLIVAKPDALVNRTLLSWRLMTFIGLISYSLYLWHWPLLSFFRFCYGESTWYARLLVLIVAFLISVLIYFKVELPARRSSSRMLIPCLVVFMAICVSLPHAVRKQYIPWKPESLTKIDQQLHLNLAEFPRQNISGHKVVVTGMDPEILFVGDSHAQMYFNRVVDLSKEHSINTALVSDGGCFIFDSETSDGHISEKCIRSGKVFKDLLGKGVFRTLVIAQKWGSYLNENKKFSKKRVLNIVHAVNQVLERGGTVYVIMDLPWSETEKSFDSMKLIGRMKMGDILEGKLTEEDDKKLKVPYPEQIDWKLGNQEIRNLLNGKVHFLDGVDRVCSSGLCDLRAYRDNDHLNFIWAKENADWIDPVFEKIAR